MATKKKTYYLFGGGAVNCYSEDGIEILLSEIKDDEYQILVDLQ